MSPEKKFSPPLPEEVVPLPDADISHIRRKWLDIPYADRSAAQKLDIYLPEDGEGPFPVILDIHGGAFMMCDKRDAHLEPLLKALDRGYAVVSVNYRLSGEAIFPAGLQDVKTAVRWVKKFGAAYHLDAARIAAFGGSAGGYYALMLGLTAHHPEFDDPSLGLAEQDCAVQAVAEWYGPTDFLKMDPQLVESGAGIPDHNDANSPESRFLGARITEIPEKVKVASPLSYIDERMPPMFIQHGRLDHLVPVQQSIILVDAIRAKGLGDRVQFEILEQADHADVLFETEENIYLICDFLDALFKA